MPNKRTPTDRPSTLDAPAIHVLKAAPKMGRPKKLGSPPMPDFSAGLSPDEAQLYEFFIASYMQDYPGMKPSDLLMLPLAAIEFIKYLRVAHTELESGEVISMARQHPGTNLARILDAILGTTRNKRVKQEPEKPEENDLLKFLSGAS